jgi:hypothetical protein
MDQKPRQTPVIAADIGHTAAHGDRLGDGQEPRAYPEKLFAHAGLSPLPYNATFPDPLSMPMRSTRR